MTKSKRTTDKQWTEAHAHDLSKALGKSQADVRHLQEIVDRLTRTEASSTRQLTDARECERRTAEAYKLLRNENRMLVKVLAWVVERMP